MQRDIVPIFHDSELWLIRVEAMPSGGMARITYPTPGPGCRYDLTGPFDMIVSSGEVERIAYR